MKKILMLILIFSIMKGSVYAGAVKTGVDENNKVTVDIYGDNNIDETFMIYVIKPDKTFIENIDMHEGEISDIYKFEQKSGKGKISYEFTLKDADEKGKYSVVVGSNALPKDIMERTAYFVYAVGDERKNALSSLNSANVNNAEDILKTYQDKVWVIDIQNEIFLTDKQRVIRNFISIKDENRFESSAEVEKAFENACTLVKIETADKSVVLNIISKYKDRLGIEPGIYYTEENDTVLSGFVTLREDKVLNPMTNISQFKDLLKRGEVLGRVNSATRENMESVLREYSEIIGIKFDDRYEKAGAYSVIKSMTPGIEESYKTIAEIEKKFNNTISKLIDESEEKPVYTGGGAKSGSSKTVTGVNTVVPIDTETIENVSEKEKMFLDLSDVKWAEDYIDYLSFHKIMNGNEKKFRPNDKITREEFVKILVEAFKITLPKADGMSIKEEDLECNYKDAEKDAWYYPYLKTASYYGLVNGINEETFGVSNSISRQDTCVLLQRFSNYMKTAITETKSVEEFADVDKIADYAVEAVKKMQKAAIINGYSDNTFLPEEGIARAEAAKLLYCLLENMDML